MREIVPSSGSSMNSANIGLAADSSSKAMADSITDFICENSDYAFILLDSAGKIAGWNKGAQSIFGYEGHEVAGRHISCLDISPQGNESDAPAEEDASATLAGAQKSGRADIDGWRLRKDGEQCFISGVITSTRSEAFGGFCLIARDVTEKKRAEEEAQKLLSRERAARAAAEAASQMKDEFLATISHDLRTPLTAILLWSRILRGGQIGEKDREEAIETIERSANAQSDMIEDLLDITRMLSGKLRLNVREMSLTPVVDAAVNAARVMAGPQGVSIHMEADGQLGRIRADPVRLQRVIWNLLTNAVRFTPRDGMVSVQLRRIDKWVRLQVTDTGEGISPESLPHVFSRFKQSDGKSPHQAGLGLGLAIAKQLVELHGGRIGAQSEGKGRGATFTIELPLVGVGEGATRGTNDGTARFAPSKMLQGIRILLVDDEADTRNVVRWLMEQSGADVLGCGSAEEARAILSHGRENAKEAPHILLSDIGMPGEDGNELLHHIRAMEKEGELPGKMPAVAITAYATREDRDRATAAGYQAFVPKPIEADELVVTVAGLVGRV